MKLPPMKCPKCAHEQHDTVKCGSCGIYFAKFRLRQRAAARRSRRAAAHSNGFGWGAIAVTAIVSAIFSGHFARGESPHAAAPRAQTVAAVSPMPATPVSLVPPATTAPTPALTTPTPALQGLAAQVAKVAPARNPIESARNATVFIETRFGFGSGFIIDAACHVITNRHVVDSEGAPPASVAVAPADLRAAMPSIEEQRLRADIEQQTQLRESLVGQPATNLQMLELDEHIQAMRQQLAALSEPRGRDSGHRTEPAQAEPDGFTVRLIDGTEFHSQHAQLSDRVDLAMFQLPAENCPHLTAADSTRLAVGERLYTIGNPSGLLHSVTSGIFSGDRGQGDQRFLQTDAPINQGNSGGPLVTESGRIVGINTKVLSGTQGIGFAIPIEAVYREFPALRTRSGKEAVVADNIAPAEQLPTS
jgi:serine protease Do